MAHTSSSNVSNIGRRLVLWLASAILLIAAGPLSAQTTVTNTASVTPPAGVVNPGTACTAAGSSFNSATGACSASDTDTVIAPQLNLAKSHAGDFTVGTNGVYTLQASNTGAAPTAGTLTVTDTLPAGLTYVSATGAGWTCSAAGQVVTCVSTTAIPAGSVATPALGAPITLTVAVAAAAAPSVTNAARASGGGDATCPAAPAATQARCNPTDLTTVASPSLTVDKTAGTPSGSTAGSTIAYSFVVTNTGNVTLTGIAINDANLDAAATCAVTTLAPGASTTCSGTHTITQAEVNAGTVDNSATATGTPPTGPAVTSPPDTTSTPIAQTASLTLDKSAVVADTNGNAVVGDPGDTITYSFSMTNTGNVTLAPVTVDDPLLPGLACTVASLAPAATASCTAAGNTYVITPADAVAGSRANTATATGDAPGTVADPTATDTETVATATLLIDAVDDTFPPVNGATGGNTATVLGNDTLNGVPVTAATVTLAPGASPNPGLSMNPDGTITIAPGTAAGTYSYPYTICEALNPANCDTATATVVVDAAPIVAVDDTNPTAINGNTGGVAITSIFANDTLNGLPVVRTEITVTNTTVPPQLLLDPASGEVSVVPGTAAGTYTFDYTICELLNPTNCATAVVTVVVAAAPIVAIDDSFPLVNGGQGGTTATVISNDTLDGQPITLGSGGNATLTPGASPNPGLVMNPDGTISIAPGTAAGTYQYPYTICEVLNPSNCDTAIATVVVGAAVIDAVDDTFPSVNGENGGSTASVLGNDTLDGVPATTATVTLAPGTSPNPGLSMNPDGTISIAPGTAAGTYSYPYTICEVLNPGNCDTATATVVVVSDFALRVLKTAAVREVKIGDLVRYTITVENVGTSNLVNGSVLDTPAAGFSYVEGSLAVVDGDNMATATGQSPIRFDGLDVAAGETAILVYAMRVGAGVRPGVQVNEAVATTQSGQSISNVSRAEVALVADALVDDSLLFGTVFDDRDSDGWQDRADLSDVHVQGGFAPNVYVPNSTTLDRGAGPQPQADASSPMLHGIDVGAISARQSVADPVGNHRVVIRQRLSELAFTDDFVLTSAQGVSVRMDAAGNTMVEKTGEAARGLNAAEPKVERRVARGEGGYVVDYVISNLGIDDRGIPGVRIASVEGLLIETDQFGRYHLEGIAGGDTGRGRNFILKVDPSTLPPGTVFTTDNPLLRRITPGLPVRFDFGVKLPVEEIQGGEQQVELELGEVIFAPGSASLREEYLPVIDRIAAKVTEYRGGEVLVSANGDSEALAFDRAMAVKTALLEKVPADIANALTVSVRAEVDDPASMVVGIAEGGPLLGTVLFDTDKSVVKPRFLPLLDKVAGYLDEAGGGSVAIVGHADPRGSDTYNIALGMRRAKAVYEALAAKLNPEVRARVRVESSNDPAAPAGSK